MFSKALIRRSVLCIQHSLFHFTLTKALGGRSYNCSLFTGQETKAQRLSNLRPRTWLERGNTTRNTDLDDAKGSISPRDLLDLHIVATSCVTIYIKMN